MKNMSRKAAIEAESEENKDVYVSVGTTACIAAEYSGKITIKSRTVVHPKAKIYAKNGPIIIGERNLIEENAEIINELTNSDDNTLYIGNDNVFEVGSYCAARRIGSNNILEAKSFIGPGIELTNGCVIGALCKLDGEETVPENTIIHGHNHTRRTLPTKPNSEELQIECLSKVFHNYHSVLRPMRKIDQRDF